MRHFVMSMHIRNMDSIVIGIEGTRNYRHITITTTCTSSHWLAVHLSLMLHLDHSPTTRSHSACYTQPFSVPLHAFAPANISIILPLPAALQLCSSNRLDHSPTTRSPSAYHCTFCSPHASIISMTQHHWNKHYVYALSSIYKGTVKKTLTWVGASMLGRFHNLCSTAIGYN